MLLAKPAVHALIWRTLADQEHSDHPQSGLFDAQLNAKPVLDCYAAIRKAYTG
jgi:hypothetical protein